MPQVILQDKLISAVANSTFIKDGTEKSCEGMKYDFRLGNRILKSGINSRVPIDGIQQLYIAPGEVVFVMTQESLDLPMNIYCQLSTKRKISHDGIIILGGFVIDPGYSGKLIFGLYNVSSRSYPIIPGRKMVAGVFYEVSDEESKCFTCNPKPMNDFPDDLIKMIDEFKSIAVESLGGQLSSIKADINRLKEQLDSDKSWKEDFKRGLGENNEQIAKLGSALNELTSKLGEEIDVRKTEISGLKRRWALVQGGAIVLGAIFGTIALGLIIDFLRNLLGW